MVPRLPALILLTVFPATAMAANPPASSPASETREATSPTLAVLPFIPASPDDAKLAEKMRFAVSQKMSRNAGVDRKDNVEVDQAISALQVSVNEPMSEEDLQKIIATLGTDRTIAGTVKGRTLTLTLYEGARKLKTASVEIPGDRDSPKLAVEKVLNDLAAVQFAHIREVECDHSDPAVEALFARRPNLVEDPSFALAAKDPRKRADKWGAILGASRYAPPLLSAEEARSLPQDRVAVVPRSSASGGGDGADKQGHCLLLRMSKNTAENNGLACESTWIPVEHGRKYRFTCRYLSTGPTHHIFLKGFATKADQFGDKRDPEATRREYYRYQVSPKAKTNGWETLEADFTPDTQKPTDPKIQWLRVDLYVYLHAGDAYFADVVVKKIEKDGK